MPDLNIQEDHGKTRGRFFAKLDDEHDAEITYSVMSPTKRIADHTGVPTKYEGQGIAMQLLLHLIEDARANNITYVPLCPYIAVHFKRHPEWNDVFES